MNNEKRNNMKCSICGKELDGSEYCLSTIDDICCHECFNKVSNPDIKDEFKKKVYHLLRNSANCLVSCSDLLDEKFKYVTTASGSSKQQVEEIKNFLKEILNDK